MRKLTAVQFDPEPPLPHPELDHDAKPHRSLLPDVAVPPQKIEVANPCGTAALSMSRY